MSPTKTTEDNTLSLQDVIRRARFGRRSWLSWYDKQGTVQYARKSQASIKQCLLDSGTKGSWVLIQAGSGNLLKGYWWLGIILLNQYKYNCASE